MKISNINNSPAFGAYHIANAKNFVNNVQNELKIYELSVEDKPFLQELKQKTNLEKLMPNINKNELAVWNNIFNIAIQQAAAKTKNGLLACFNDMPCGIAAFTRKPHSFKIDTICAIPTQNNGKIPLTGKSLFSIIFRDFLDSKAAFINLDAVTNGPFSAVAKYMQLGFKQRGGENGIIAMRINRDRACNSLAMLNGLIKVETLNPDRKISLFNFLS